MQSNTLQQKVVGFNCTIVEGRAVEFNGVRSLCQEAPTDFGHPSPVHSSINFFEKTFEETEKTMFSQCQEPGGINRRYKQMLDQSKESSSTNTIAITSLSYRINVSVVLVTLKRSIEIGEF